MANRTKRQKAILKRNLFVGGLIAFLVAVIVGIAVLMPSIIGAIKGNNSSDQTSGSNTPSSSDASSASSDTSSKADTSSAPSSSTVSKPENVPSGELDPNFSCLLLVNGENPLPDSYDSEVRASLVTIDKKYRNNDYVTQIHKDVYPYITAMVAAAQKEGVDLRVWSPFRSYAIQNDLFQKQVERMKNRGYKGKEAEDKAATVVARPGTSEHNTGLCADFNMASDSFANTKMYTWMTKNAENYGFIMRYDAKKQSITGVIHESWHWRFVGINAAKEMNDLDMCLEEYVEYLKTK
ncbi:MAG: M15 family metallopeptidase [Oscillospiraceae bacterium]|nr:M15 family metallopeptidase [Oscillospiraceae bacterium]